MSIPAAPPRYPSFPSPQSQYGYLPELSVGITGLSFFTLSTIAHAVQMSHYRMWWCSVLVVGGITEMIGYAARIYSTHDDTNNDAFLAQTVTLIIAPSFFSAALYIVFMKIIVIIGPQYSALRPSLYIWFFCAADILSLVIQAIGGGMASQGSLNLDQSLSDLGTHIMVAGICWQMFTMSIFVLLAIQFVFRTLEARVVLPHKLQVFCVGMTIVTVMIFIRCIYRTIELLGGWQGYIITHEVYFICLEEVPMVIALVAFNVFHPGMYLPDLEPAAEQEHTKCEPFKGEETEMASSFDAVQVTVKPTVVPLPDVV